MIRVNVLLAAAALLGVTAAQASVTDVLAVSMQGPGGHSNGAYGRTNAVHAAARAIVELDRSIPYGQCVISDFNGGNSVNSIAADGRFRIVLKAKDAAQMKGLREKVTKALDKGVSAENAFRGVKPGDTTAGVAAAVSYTVTQVK